MISPISIHPLERGAFYRENQLHPDTDSDDQHEILERSSSSTYPEGKKESNLPMQETLPPKPNSLAFKITYPATIGDGTTIQAQRIQQETETDTKTYYFQVPKMGFPPIPSRNHDANLRSSPLKRDETAENTT